MTLQASEIWKGLCRPMIETCEIAVNSGKEMFSALLNQLEKVHAAGLLYGEISKSDLVMDECGEWNIAKDKPLYKQGTYINTQNEYIGWKKHNRAPEFKCACPKGTEYYPTKTADIYSLIYSIYETITGRKPRLNFQLDRHWTSILEESFGCDTDSKREALQQLFEQCVEISVYHRIQSCQQLKNTEEYRMLFAQ